jgi:hypothetical protein
MKWKKGQQIAFYKQRVTKRWLRDDFDEKSKSLSHLGSAKAHTES